MVQIIIALRAIPRRNKMNKLTAGLLPYHYSNLKREEWLSPFDKILDELMSASNPDLHKVFGDSVFEKNAYPKVNIVDNKDSITIEASVPGLRKEEVFVEVEGNVLTISSRPHKELADDNSDSKYLTRELKKSSFMRSFTLSKELDTSSVKADLDLGLLTITINKLIPRKEIPQRKKIAIG